MAPAINRESVGISPDSEGREAATLFVTIAAGACAQRRRFAGLERQSGCRALHVGRRRSGLEVFRVVQRQRFSVRVAGL